MSAARVTAPEPPDTMLTAAVVSISATLLLVSFCAFPVLGIVAQHRLEASTGDLRQVVDTWQARTSATEAGGKQTLKDLVTEQCGAAPLPDH